MSEEFGERTTDAAASVEYDGVVVGESAGTSDAQESAAIVAGKRSEDAAPTDDGATSADELSPSGLGGRIDDTAPSSALGAVPSDVAGEDADELASNERGDSAAPSDAESSAADELSPSGPSRRTDGDAPSSAPSDEPSGVSAEGGKSAVAARSTENVSASDKTVADLTPEPLDDDEFRSALEAMLLIVDAPAPVELLADALRDSPARVERALLAMSAELSARASGIDLRFVGDGWRFYTRSEYAPYVERMLLDGARSKLTRAALETLAVVAYRQPVTRTRVSAVRGVNVDGVMRTLLARGLIAEAGVDPETNGTQYRTTELFLERIGLASLTDLPPLAPLLPGVDLIDEINESLETDPRYTRLKKSAETDLDLGTEED